MTYDSRSYDLAEHFLHDHPLVTSAHIDALAKAIQTTVEDYLSELEVPEPCTSAAFSAGCTCRMSPVNSASIDPPEPIVDRNCPLHGSYRDPDAEREEQRELGAENYDARERARRAIPILDRPYGYLDE